MCNLCSHWLNTILYKFLSNFNKILINQKNLSQFNLKCINCNTNDLIEDYSQGTLLCKNCGQVLEGVIDFNPEWKQFDDEDKSNARCGMPINIHLPQSSIGTTISGMGRSRIKIHYSRL